MELPSGSNFLARVQGIPGRRKSARSVWSAERRPVPLSALRSALKPIRVERHLMGPRLFVFDRRLHECHAGAALLAAGVVFLLADSIAWPVPAVVALVATWML